MAQEERYGYRGREYSVWHRRNSTRRFVGIEHAQRLAMIDVDAAIFLEYDDGTKEPMALVEVARDVGQDHKTATVTQTLAAKAKIPAYVVLYTLSDQANPADKTCCDIQAFRVRLLNPYVTAWVLMSPVSWAKYLLRVREFVAGVCDGLWPPEGSEPFGRFPGPHEHVAGKVATKNPSGPYHERDIDDGSTANPQKTLLSNP